jgi:rod shape-determining protein MreC
MLRKKPKNKGVKNIVVIGAVIALVFLANIGAINGRLVKFGLHISSPAIYLKNKINAFTDKILINFKSKEDLVQKNNFLAQENLLLKSKAAMKDILEKENLKILQAFGRSFEKASEEKAILSSILYRPPYSESDTLIIDAGLKEGIKNGMMVTAFGDILLGYVSDVLEHSSRVKLISFFGEETNVFLENAGVPAIAQGEGGGNFKIILPRDSKVEVGEKVSTIHIKPFLIGAIEKIKKSDSDFFLKAYFRFPINIYELRYVLIRE